MINNEKRQNSIYNWVMPIQDHDLVIKYIESPNNSEEWEETKKNSFYLLSNNHNW